MLKRIMIIIMFVVCIGGVSNADTIYFDDIGGTLFNHPIEDHYDGFIFTNGNVLEMDEYSNAASGFYNGVVSVNNIMYNPAGEKLEINSSVGFDFNNIYMTAAIDSFDVTVNGTSDNDEHYSSIITVNSDTPTLAIFDWENIRHIEFNMQGNYCAFDNFTFNETAPVPIPPTLLLFGSSLIGMAAIGRKKLFK